MIPLRLVKMLYEYLYSLIGNYTLIIYRESLIFLMFEKHENVFCDTFLYQQILGQKVEGEIIPQKKQFNRRCWY
jgi:hypothetical protein